MSQDATPDAATEIEVKARLDAAERDAIPDNDFAQPPDGFPIRDQDHLDAAARDLGRIKDPAEREKVKQRAIQIARRKGLSIPDTWKDGGKGDDGKSLGPISSIGDMLIYFGHEVKALGDGHLGGYLVRFSGPNDPDLSGDFFTSSCDFNLGDDGTARVPVLYDHGLDPTVGKRKIGKGSVRLDDVGVWLDAQLNMRDEYEKAIYAMAEKGKLGLSSGSAGHMIERVAVGKSTRLDSWPIVEASLTPTPCEPRTLAVPLKSLLPAKAMSEGDDTAGGELDPDDTAGAADADPAAAHPGFPSARAKATADALGHIHAEHGKAVKAMMADGDHPMHDEDQPPRKRLAALGKSHDDTKARSMAVARHMMTGPSGPHMDVPDDAKGVYITSDATDGPIMAPGTGEMAPPDDDAADAASALAALCPQFDYIRAGLCSYFAGTIDRAAFRAILDDASEDILILCTLKDEDATGDGATPSEGVKALIAALRSPADPTKPIADVETTPALDPAGLVAAAEGYRDLARKFAAVREDDGRSLGEIKRQLVAATVAGLAPVLADLQTLLATPGRADRLKAARLAQAEHRTRLAGATFGLGSGPDTP